MRKKDDEKRNRIKKAVIETILVEGFHGTSISKIAKAAKVSPATVYIYYENKEEMLKDIYEEYLESFYQYLTSHLVKELSGKQFIDVLIRHYYQYIVDHQEIFNFIEQFNSCPALSQGCKALGGPTKLSELLALYKSQGVLYDYHSQNIVAMLFYPVKSIAKRTEHDSESINSQLDEMIMIIQKALLK